MSLSPDLGSGGGESILSHSVANGHDFGPSSPDASLNHITGVDGFSQEPTILYPPPSIAPAPETTAEFIRLEGDRVDSQQILDLSNAVRDAWRAVSDADSAANQYLTWGDPHTGNHLVDVGGVPMVAHKGEFRIGGLADLKERAEAAREDLGKAETALRATQNERNPNGYPWVSAGLPLAGLIASTLQKTDQFAENASDAIDDATARRIIRGVLRCGPRVAFVLVGGLFGAVACSGSTLVPRSEQHTPPPPSPTPEQPPSTPVLLPDTPTPPPDVIDGLAPADVLAGLPPGAGGAGEEFVSQHLSEDMKQALHALGLSPIAADGVVSWEQQAGENAVVCWMPYPETIYNPDLPDQAEEVMVQNTGEVVYGEGEIPLTRAVNAIPLVGLPENIICISTYAWEDNAFGVAPGSLITTLVDTRINAVVAWARGAFSADTTIKLELDETPRLLVDGVELPMTILNPAALTPPPPTEAPTPAPTEEPPTSCLDQNPQQKVMEENGFNDLDRAMEDHIAKHGESEMVYIANVGDPYPYRVKLVNPLVLGHFSIETDHGRGQCLVLAYPTSQQQGVSEVRVVSALIGFVIDGKWVRIAGVDSNDGNSDTLARLGTEQGFLTWIDELVTQGDVLKTVGIALVLDQADVEALLRDPSNPNLDHKLALEKFFPNMDNLYNVYFRDSNAWPKNLSTQAPDLVELTDVMRQKIANGEIPNQPGLLIDGFGY